MKKFISILFISITFGSCTTSTNFISNPSSPYLLNNGDSILVAEMENVSAYESQQLLTSAFSNNPVCITNYSYAVDNEKNLMQWDISLPSFSDNDKSSFQKLIQHTPFDYLVLSRLIRAKSGETIYEGDSRGLVDYKAEEVTVGFKLFELKTGLLVKDFLVTSTRKPIKHRDSYGEIHEIPAIVKSPIGRAVSKGFKKIAEESQCK